MSSSSRSLFFNQSVSNGSRPIYNPVGSTGGGGGTGGGTGGGSCELGLIDTTNYNFLNIIDVSYVQNMNSDSYADIPSDYSEYIQLYATVNSILNQASDPRLVILLKLVLHALTGALNSYSLYGSSLICAYDKTILQNTIADILSGKNKDFVTPATGQLSIKKSFKLATVFTYYIALYGMPAFGVGFDASKISFLANILKQNGIDPYN